MEIIAEYSIDYLKSVGEENIINVYNEVIHKRNECDKNSIDFRLYSIVLDRIKSIYNL